MNKFKKYWVHFTCIIIFVCFIALSVFSATRESLTYDEIVYFQTGIEALKNQKFDIDTNNPPLIKEIGALPAFLIDIDTNPYKISSEKIFYSRLMILFLGSILLFSVFLACKSYFGLKTALFAVFLLAFEPNILGNSHYFTLDIGVTLFLFISYILFLKVLEKVSLVNISFWGIFLGLALSSKITAISYVLLISPVIIFINFKRKSLKWILKNKKYLVLAFSICIFTIWSTYFFKTDVLIAKREDSNRVSSKLLAFAKANEIKLIESAVYFAQNQRIPLGNYMASIKNSMIRSKQKSNVFFLGKNYSDNKWYFMPVNFLLKTPLPIFIFLALSFTLFVRKKKIRKNYILFIIPVILILLISSFSNMNPWIRYILPLYPFLIISASTSINYFNKFYLKIIFLVLCFWYILGTLNSFPHFISYANELVADSNRKYEFFIDSNIDWGQSLPDFKNYIEIQKPKLILFSYFGRDSGDYYNLKSDKNYGSHKFNDICAFHNIKFPDSKGEKLTAISISNWYYCGYYKNKMYSKEKVVDVVGDSILIFK